MDDIRDAGAHVHSLPGTAGMGAGTTPAQDPVALRADLDAVLASKGLAFAPDLSESMRDELRGSWRQLAHARGGALSGADIHDALATYLRLSLLSRPVAAAADAARDVAPGVPEEAADLIAAAAPRRPTGPDGPYPTIMRLTPADGDARGAASVAGGVAYGGLSDEFGALAFESQGDTGTLAVLPVTRVDQRFARLVHELALRHVALVAVGEAGPDGLDVWDLRAVDDLPKGESLQTMSPDLLELMLQRLRALPEPSSQMRAAAPRRPEAPAPMRPRIANLEEAEEYLACMEDTLPARIRDWAYQNLELAHDSKASKEERGHATRALTLMLSIQWGRPPFRRVDPVRARAILDKQLFGLDAVKQRVVETVVQINRTHTLPLYGLLLAGPAGVGKSQIAYATARILHLPWASLDMSAIRDLGALAGTDRIYANAKPGRVMEALAQAGSATMALVINELDKADEGGQGGSSADALLTLFDNLGFTDNYVGCPVPTDGIYPIATANELSRINAPLLSRLEVIEIPDYTPDEKRTILREYSLPKVLAHMGLRGEEFEVTDAGLDRVIERYRDTSGCRDLEKATEHLAAHALFLLESDPARGRITFDAPEVEAVLDA